MGNWIFCEYYDASLNPTKPNKGLPLNDSPVNLELCATIRREDNYSSDKYFVHFLIPNSETITWEFINTSLRDLEYERAISLMKKHVLVN